MKIINNAVLRSILGIVLGFIFVLWPDIAVIYLVILIGIFFLTPGLYKLIMYMTKGEKGEDPQRTFPIDGVGSILFGGWLIIQPAFFVNIFMYILGALLVVAGLQQLIMLYIVRKNAVVPWSFYIFPTLIFIAGIMIVAYPFNAATNTFVIFGATSMVYGICELVNWYKFRPGKY